MRCRVALALALAAALAAVTSGPALAQSATEGVRSVRFDNGFTVLVRENPVAPVVAVALLVRMGSRWETPANNGISNFTHAVMVKGTMKRGGGDIAEAVASLDQLSREIEERGGDPIPLLEFVRGDALMRLGRAEEAESAFLREIELFPGDTVAYGSLGAIYLTLTPRYRLADQVPDREQAIAASEQLDEKLTGANPLHVMVDWPQGKSLYDLDVLKVVGDVHSLVETQSGVGNVWSIETLRRWLAKTQEDTPERLKQYVDILPDYLTKRFLAPEHNSVVVTGRIPDVDVSDLLPVIEHLDKALEAIRQANPGYRIVVTGLSAIAARNSATMIGNLNAGLTWEIIFICAFMGLVFRSLMVMAVSVLPIVFPVFAAGALLALSGEGLQFASIVALIVSFGLSLNATVHYLNRLRLEYLPGEDPAISVERATVLIGPALVLTTVILAFGLGVTVLSDLPSLRLFGKLAALTLMAALIGDLVLLPASVLLARRVMQRFATPRAERPSRAGA